MKIKKPKKPLESLILTVRSHKVLMDADLAGIYGVPTKIFNQAVIHSMVRLSEIGLRPRGHGLNCFFRK